ncbi:MgtC/SapB family protein [Bosea sp. BK604]|uniref:MgtC/SapB family protein n=1 Tax=Bosea sp. BK604 TaxID=2512180 RepID=UPI0010539D66|nr:MgtC/SapB family protein [Bosea sp. BK604]TCR65711.1 putative Mg2+ transporter-C (MgtC) family protein [Bosea sp. BK604]
MDFDIWSEIDLTLRLLAGTAAGVVVGWERTLKQSAAGIRTFGLVGLGTAAAAGIFGDPGQIDAASRVVQGVLTGIGFLGAGVIILREKDQTPRGLTTAAAIWITAALGCAAGLGDWQIVLTATTLALVLLAVNHSIERWAGRDEEPTAAEPDAAEAAHPHGGTQARPSSVEEPA